MAIYVHNEVVGSPTTPWTEVLVGPVIAGGPNDIVLSNIDGSETRFFSFPGDFAYDQVNDVLTGTITSFARTSPRRRRHL